MNFNDYIVNFDTAVLLKKLGYPQKCLGTHLMTSDFYTDEGKFYKNGGIVEVERSFTAPNLFEVCEWLEKEKQIYTTTIPFPSFASINKVVWNYVIKYNSDGANMIVKESEMVYIHKEEAIKDCITYILNNILKN